ncbi:hypothetical protein BH23BAC4_BH23BAC4_03310 [soil metagenome]
MEAGSSTQRRATPYRLEILPIVLPFHRRARQGASLLEGDLVYYGPMPTYYGIGEVIRSGGKYVVVDFRGTGAFGVHEETIEREYVLPIPSDRRSLL